MDALIQMINNITDKTLLFGIFFIIYLIYKFGLKCIEFRHIIKLETLRNQHQKEMYECKNKKEHEN